MPGRLSYNFVKEQIESKEYKLLSTEYKNMKTLLEVVCPNGHIINKTYENIMKAGCRECYNKPLTIEYVKDKASNYGFEILSTEFKNTRTKMEVRCVKKGHLTFKTWNNMISKKGGCYECGSKKILEYNNVKEFIENIDEYKLISTEYKRIDNKLEIQCPKHHIFKMSFQSFQYGQRCPECYNLDRKRSENAARKIIEEYYNKPFKTIRPEWLKNPKTNRNLELDGYNEELKLGFEYNGLQHYEPVKAWGGEKKYLDLVEKDKLKASKCEELGIKLIIIPYKYNCYDVNKMKEFILSQL